MARVQRAGLAQQIDQLELVFRGFGQGREAFIKIITGTEGSILRNKVTKLTDATRVKFGGTRSPRPRRWAKPPDAKARSPRAWTRSGCAASALWAAVRGAGLREEGGGILETEMEEAEEEKKKKEGKGTGRGEMGGFLLCQ